MTWSIKEQLFASAPSEDNSGHVGMDGKERRRNSHEFKGGGRSTHDRIGGDAAGNE